MLTVHALPELRRPVIVGAFSGWSDAGASASGALAYLAIKWHTRRIAEFDSDSLYTYTITRPVTGRDAGGRRQLHWPDLAFWTVALPGAERDLVLLRGPEPDLLWRRCARSIVELAQRLGAELLLTLGCFGAPVVHSAPTPVMAATADPALRRRLDQLGLHDTQYEGPTAFTSAIIDQAALLGLPAASLWAATPSYLQGVTNPKVSLALLRAVEQLGGFRLGLDELQAAARDMEQRIERALRERPDLRRFVQEAQRPSGEEAAPAQGEESGADELPSPQAVLEDLEAYLRQLQRQDEQREQSEDT